MFDWNEQDISRVCLAPIAFEGSFCFRFNGSVADRRNRVGRELANDFEKEAHDFAAGTAGLCMGSALTTRRRINSRFGFLCATMISE